MDKKASTFRTWVLSTFSDRLMTELALLLIPTTLLPLLFPFSPVSLMIFHLINLIVVVVFVLEYILKLSVAKPHWKYILDPWHILDLAIILFAAIDFFPFVPVKGWRASPLLRLLRLARVFALTGRVVRRVTPPIDGPTPEEPIASKMRMSNLTEKYLRQDASLYEVQAAINDPQENWVDIHSISQVDINVLSQLFSIPVNVLESKLLGDNFPGIDFFPAYSIITLWDAKWGKDPEDNEVQQIANPRVVIICSQSYIATLSLRPFSFSDQLVEERRALPKESFSIQVLYSILRRKIDDYKLILQKLEKIVAGLEDITSDKKPPKFLDTTFQLKKIIQKQGYNISHFAQVLDQTVKNSVSLKGERGGSSSPFIPLHSEAESLNDLCHNIRDNITSLIELQLNKVSFDLNRVMKLLAVITCLAIIPTIIGGLLGQNLKDQPYNITIGEIFFFVISIMLIGLYVFYRKGWLK